MRNVGPFFIEQKAWQARTGATRYEVLRSRTAAFTGVYFASSVRSRLVPGVGGTPG